MYGTYRVVEFARLVDDRTCIIPGISTYANSLDVSTSVTLVTLVTTVTLVTLVTLVKDVKNLNDFSVHLFLLRIQRRPH